MLGLKLIHVSKIPPLMAKKFITSKYIPVWYENLSVKCVLHPALAANIDSFP